MCDRAIDIVSFYDFSFRFFTFSNNVLFLFYFDLILYKNKNLQITTIYLNKTLITLSQGHYGFHSFPVVD